MSNDVESVVSRQGRNALRPSCNVCNDLDSRNFGAERRFKASFQQLAFAAESGCLSCSLVLTGISGFICALQTENQESLKILKAHNVNMAWSRQNTLYVRISVQSADKDILNVPLEFFSIASSYAWSAIGESVCVPRKLDLTRLVMTTTAWIQNCNLHHFHCRLPDSYIMPTRVLDVGSREQHDDIKLALNLETPTPYIALSYCWGKPEDMIQATQLSLPNFIEFIPWQKLPKTFQDAITFTRALGIQYLWIDALCILQDDEEDWEREAAKMATIYTNSYLTIAATSASDSRKGLFLDRWTKLKGQDGMKLPVTAHKVSQTGQDSIFVRPQLHLAHDRFLNMENAEEHADDSPLLTRAWAFQERLLPSRAIHFHAEELVWECKSNVQCECTQLDKRFPYEKVGMQGWLKNFVTGVLHDNRSAEELGFVWLDLVSEFSRLHLTYESDRLPALSGLAQSFSQKALGAYFCGLWEHDLARGLLFETVKSMEKRTENLSAKYPQDLAPTWSWASIHLVGPCRISYSCILKYGLVQDPSFKNLYSNPHPAGTSAVGSNFNAVLKLQGAFATAKLGPNTSSQKGIQWERITLEVEGAQVSVPSSLFISDGRTEPTETNPLIGMLIGRSIYPWGGADDMEARIHEYVLVLQRATANLDSYKRVGLLFVSHDHQLFRHAPVVTIQVL